MSRLLFVGLGILCALWAGQAQGLPLYDEVRKSYAASDAVLVDREGVPLYEERTDKHHRRLAWTVLADISPALVQAVIQAEDKRFYDHRGVDFQSIGVALIKGLTAEGLRGASTITMQLASLLDCDLQPKKGKRTVWQKGRQALEAREMERRWSKGQILEAYLNLITFRGELQGIAAAARGLFGKDPHGLDQAEALVLASLIRSPNAASTEIAARALLLRQALSWSAQEAEINATVSRTLWGGSTLRTSVDLASHVARLLIKGSIPGQRIACTLDMGLQRFVLERIRHHLSVLRSQNVTDAAVLVIANKTGDVLAYASYSGDPAHGWFVDGVQAKRQAGSTLKPFLYALAFDRRILTPASVLADTPLDIAVFAGIYQPRDYDSEFKGLVTARVALASSLNVPAVKTLALVGLEPFLGKLRMLGITGLNEEGDFYGPSLALGSADVSLWELTNAYRCLANEGVWRKQRLTPGGGSSPGKRVFARDAVYLVADILADREARSTTFGLENPLATRFWTAVKTGTSKDMRDNWCIGYSRRYTVGVWVGNFSGEAMWDVSGITGAAPIWIEVMNQLHFPDSNPEMRPPQSLVKQEIQFPQGIEPARAEWFIQGTEPNEKERRVGQLNQRIVYPPSGTIIALDPDIPPDLQRVFFIAQPQGKGLRWVLNDDTIMAADANLPWAPLVGTYTLTLVDDTGRAIDAVRFEVRGPSLRSGD
ncbi:MAG: penicillin-binding protein 1C [Desulfobacterales bacterium]|nr:penicillin-binding protein 1C [Desulfobacterales bacterium]